MWYNKGRYHRRGIVFYVKKSYMGVEPMSSKPKNLTIGNTNRYVNFHLLDKSEIAKKIKVSSLNAKEIEEEMDELAKQSRRIPKKNDKEYIVYHEKYVNDTLVDKIIKHGGKVSYYTTTIVPYYILKKLSMNLDSEVIYAARKTFTPEECHNVELAYTATKVIIDIPIVIPDTNPYDCLFSLHSLKTNVDRVQLSFPPLQPSEHRGFRDAYYKEKDDGLFHLDPYHKYEFTQRIRVSLSIWKMYVYLITENEEDYREINQYLERFKNKRNSSRKKKGKVGGRKGGK